MTLFIISRDLNVIYNDQGSVRASFSFQKGQRQTKEAQMFQLGGGGIGINCFSMSSNASASWCETHRSKVFKICMETWNKLDVQSKQVVYYATLFKFTFSRISRFEEFSKLNSWGKNWIGTKFLPLSRKTEVPPFQRQQQRMCIEASLLNLVKTGNSDLLTKIPFRYLNEILFDHFGENSDLLKNISPSLTSNETLLCQVPKKK